jgi:hypothetical protein
VRLKNTNAYWGRQKGTVTLPFVRPKVLKLIPVFPLPRLGRGLGPLPRSTSLIVCISLVLNSAVYSYFVPSIGFRTSSIHVRIPTSNPLVP